MAVDFARTGRRASPDDAPGPIRSVHDALRSQFHRAILYHLQDQGEPVSLAAVGRAVATSSGAPGSAKPTDPARAYHRDVRAHVLDLAEIGLLDYDPGADAVRIPEDVTISVALPWTVPSRAFVTGDPSGPAGGD